MKKAAGPLALGPPFGAGSVLSSAHTKNACVGLALVLYLANNTLLNLYSNSNRFNSNQLLRFKPLLSRRKRLSL